MVAVGVVWEMARASVLRVMCGQSAFPLNLGGSGSKEIDVQILSIVGASS